MFEFGFSVNSGLFSCPGLLTEWSRSAFSVSVLSWALTAREASAALARPAEPTPKKVRLDSPSTPGLLSCCSLARFSPSKADLGPFGSRIGIPLLSFIVLLTCIACDGAGMLLLQLLCQLEAPRNALVIKASALLGSGLTPRI